MKRHDEQIKYFTLRKLIGRFILGVGYLSLLIITAGSIQKSEVTVSHTLTDSKEVVWKE